jgi:hypothetical protein
MEPINPLENLRAEFANFLAVNDRYYDDVAKYVAVFERLIHEIEGKRALQGGEGEELILTQARRQVAVFKAEIDNYRAQREAAVEDISND